MAELIALTIAVIGIATLISWIYSIFAPKNADGSRKKLPILPTTSILVGLFFIYYAVYLPKTKELNEEHLSGRWRSKNLYLNLQQNGNFFMFDTGNEIKSNNPWAGDWKLEGNFVILTYKEGTSTLETVQYQILNFTKKNNLFSFQMVNNKLNEEFVKVEDDKENP